MKHPLVDNQLVDQRVPVLSTNGSAGLPRTAVSDPENADFA